MSRNKPTYCIVMKNPNDPTLDLHRTNRGTWVANCNYERAEQFEFFAEAQKKIDELTPSSGRELMVCGYGWCDFIDEGAGTIKKPV